MPSPASTKKTAPAKPAPALLRANQGARPQIIFTSDFHELVTGDLVPGPCSLRYDPLRLVQLGDAAHEHHHIRAFVRFHPLGTEWQGSLHLPAGLPLADLADASGQGLMLETSFTIPPQCDELEVWFSCTHPDGETHWDSDFGKNHWLRFGLADLTIRTAQVVTAKKKEAAQDTLALELVSNPKIEALRVRWRVTSNPALPRQITPLKVATANATSKTWIAPDAGIPIPKGATIAYDLVYEVAGRTHTDDNQGRWYIAD